MTLANESMRQDRRLVQYMLGLLPEDDTERLDEASIVDDDVAAQLRGVEDDLVDGYVSGTLELATRHHFEAHYLKSPRRRERVKFARRFLAVLDRASTARAETAEIVPAAFDRERHFSGPDTKPRARSRFTWSLLTAAASLLLVCGVVVKDLQLREGLKLAQRQGAAQDGRSESLTRQLDEARSANAQIADALERARSASALRDRQSAPASSADRGGSAPIVTSAMVLFPQTRSIGQLPTIDVPPGSRTVSFELRLESNDFLRYRALLKNPDTNRIVWRSPLLYARRAARSFVAVVVPSSVLESKHYSIELAGIDAAATETTIGSYPVQVDRR